jgi:fatty acid desaturase
LVILFGFFVRWFVLLATTGIAEYPPEVVAINCRMIGTWMLWAFILQEFFELLLHHCLPASQRTIHSRDEDV